jgi:hypothetical protein
MKKTIFAVLMLCTLGVSAQKVKVDKSGNYIAVKDSAIAGVPTGKTLTETDGTVYPVFKLPTGKMYTNRISKAGKAYRRYLKTE